MPRLLDRGVVVPVHELLLQQPVRRFDHGAVVGVALARQRSFDVEHVEQLVDPRVVELAAPVGVEHLDVRQREVEGGECGRHQARVPGPPGGMAGDAPVRQTDQQAHVRPSAPYPHVCQVARRMRVRGVAVELAVQQVRELRLVGSCHACLRANTGAACSETSTSISNRRSRLLGPTGSFCSGVRLSAARVEPLSRMPWTQRRGVDRTTARSAV